MSHAQHLILPQQACHEFSDTASIIHVQLLLLYTARKPSAAGALDGNIYASCCASIATSYVAGLACSLAPAPFVLQRMMRTGNVEQLGSMGARASGLPVEWFWPPSATCSCKGFECERFAITVYSRPPATKRGPRWKFFGSSRLPHRVKAIISARAYRTNGSTHPPPAGPGEAEPPVPHRDRAAPSCEQIPKFTDGGPFCLDSLRQM